MTLNRLFPLEINPQTQEPFLRLRKNNNTILTPMRWEDVPHLVPLFNDPRVYKWLMTGSDAEEWLQKNKPGADALLQELKDAQGIDELKIVGGAAIGSIREVREDDTDTFLGYLAIGRCFHPELLDTDTIDWEHAKERAAANNALDAGDPSIVWSFGDYLASSHHGQGIMTDAMNTLLYEWAIPRMNVRKMLVGAFIGNHGSIRVFEKNGFTMIRTIDEHSVVKGEMRGLHVMEWSLGGNA